MIKDKQDYIIIVRTEPKSESSLILQQIGTFMEKTWRWPTQSTIERLIASVEKQLKHPSYYHTVHTVMKGVLAQSWGLLYIFHWGILSFRRVQQFPQNVRLVKLFYLIETSK